MSLENLTFRTTFTKFGNSDEIILTNQVASIDKPSIDFQKKCWQPIKIDFDENDDISKLVGHQIQKQLNHFEATGFMAGTHYKFNILLETLENGEPIETWLMEGCFITAETTEAILNGLGCRVSRKPSGFSPWMNAN